MTARLALEAVVLSGSGCGSTDAYGVGVLKALADGAAPTAHGAFEPSIYTGAAFGAFNAAMMTMDPGDGTAASVRRLEQAWLEGLCSTASRPNGVYRIRCSPMTLLDPRSWFDPVSTVAATAKDVAYLTSDLVARVRAQLSSAGAASIGERITDMVAVTPFFDMSPLRAHLRAFVDLARVRSSTKTLMVNATDWERGIGRIFTNVDMTDAQGHDILQASAAYLVMFPFVDIGGRPFGGGPGSLATPLKPVVETFAPRTDRLTVHTVYIHPPMTRIPLGHMPGVFAGTGRYFDMVESLNVSADVEYGPGQAPLASTSNNGASVTIHRYRPSAPIVDWFRVFEFDRTKTEAFIAQGYRDTQNHDCRAAGCVCPT
jgi:predicted acylesterase/phospholipase RssA